MATYLGATALAGGLVDRKIRQRAAIGKEDIQRLRERFGEASVSRPDGPLVWFHAASVGESLSILELITQLLDEAPDLCVLVTTGTATAAALLATRLPDRVIHQYVPVDTVAAVRGFLDHWSPDLAIWTESEFWPRLMVETHKRGTPMVLVNGRITEKTRDQWKWLRGMSRSLLGRFDLMMVQSDAMGDAFRAIGADDAKLVVTGSLKEGAIPLPHDPIARKDIVRRIGRRAVWLAASTHDGEEEIVLTAHQQVLRRSPEALLILAPRHPARGAEIAEAIRVSGLGLARRSLGQAIDTRTEVYLADTLGEMGLWYRVAPVSFVGGSLVSVGGHNPFEPAALGSAILHGPHVFNFDEIYARLAAAGGAMPVVDADSLATAVLACLHADASASLAAAAWDVSSEGAGVTDVVMEHLRPFVARICGS